MALNLTFEVSHISYCIDVPEEDFLRLSNREFEHPELTSLCEDLEAIEGIREVDYDGHFGSCVYVTIEAEHDNDQTKNQVIKVISNHLSKE